MRSILFSFMVYNKLLTVFTTHTVYCQDKINNKTNVLLYFYAPWSITHYSVGIFVCNDYPIAQSSIPIKSYRVQS